MFTNLLSRLSILEFNLNSLMVYTASFAVFYMMSVLSYNHKCKRYFVGILVIFRS